MASVPMVLLYLILAIASATLAIYAWSRRYYRSGRPFTLLMAALAYWCCARALAIADPSFDGTVFWALAQVGGIVLIMPAWLLVALSFTGQRWRHQPPVLAAIFVPTAILFMLAMSNSLHHLWWISVEPDTSRGFMWFRPVWGPVFWVHTAYAYLCFVFSMGLLVHTALHTRRDRRQVWLMIMAAMLPAASNVAYLAGARPIGTDDPTPIALFFGGLIALYATIHFRAIDLNPHVSREALEALPNGIIVLDNDRYVAEINGAATDLLGVERRAALGRPLKDLLANKPLETALQGILDNPDEPRTQLVAYADEAGERTLEARIRPLRAVNGAIAGALLILHDVSERVRAEQAQAQHVAELSLITRVARVTNTAPDAAGLVRAAAETIAAAGIWDRVIVGLLTPDGARLDVVADIATSGATDSYEGKAIDGAEVEELIALLRAGESRSLDLSDPATANSVLGRAIADKGIGHLLLTPLFHRGAPLGMLALGTTSTHPHRSAQPRLAETIGELITDAVVRARLYDEVRRADQLKTAFLASVSHELRTPLTAIIGYIEMFRRGIYGPLDERFQEPLSYMHLSSTTLLRMINDILDFSRAEAGYLQVELQPVNLRHVIANVIVQLQPQIQERGLDFEIEIAPDLPMVQGNRGRLEQVVVNLLSNALKFTDRGSIAVRAWQVDNRVRLSVTDTGVGIAPEHQALIFQEFRRIETPNRRVGGAGLGLAISRRLVELMGGSISVSSELGKGSTFTVELPIATTTATPPATQAAPETEKRVALEIHKAQEERAAAGER